MQTVGIWLLPLAAIVLSTPLAADGVESQWPDTAIVETSTVNLLPRLGEDAQQSDAPQLPVSSEKKIPEARKFCEPNDASRERALSVGEKWKLFSGRTYDPIRIVSTGLSSAIGQAADSHSGYGQGMEGYGRRFGASYGDKTLGSFFGTFALPSLLHDDPRYFRKGSGPFLGRLMHASAATVITRRDNGSSRPNYSNVFGNLIGCAIGSVYYPPSERTVGDTMERGLMVTAYGAIGGIFQEFWPDIHKKIFKPSKAPEVK